MCSSQIASSFKRRRPSIHCSGTEKLPPPCRYFAANPPPRKTVTGLQNRESVQRSTSNATSQSELGPVNSRRTLVAFSGEDRFRIGAGNLAHCDPAETTNQRAE